MFRLFKPKPDWVSETLCNVGQYRVEYGLREAGNKHKGFHWKLYRLKDGKYIKFEEFEDKDTAVRRARGLS